MIARGKDAATHVLDLPIQFKPTHRHVADRDRRADGRTVRRIHPIHHRGRDLRCRRIVVNDLEYHRCATFPGTIHRVRTQVGGCVDCIIIPLAGGIRRRASRDRALAHLGHVLGEIGTTADGAHHVDVDPALRQGYGIISVESHHGGTSGQIDRNAQPLAAISNHVDCARRQRTAEREGVSR